MIALLICFIILGILCLCGLALLGLTIIAVALTNLYDENDDNY